MSFTDILFLIFAFLKFFYTIIPFTQISQNLLFFENFIYISYFQTKKTKKNLFSIKTTFPLPNPFQNTQIKKNKIKIRFNNIKKKVKIKKQKISITNNIPKPIFS